MKKPLS